MDSREGEKPTLSWYSMICTVPENDTKSMKLGPLPKQSDRIVIDDRYEISRWELFLAMA